MKAARETGGAISRSKPRYLPIKEDSEIDEAGDVAARPVQAGDESAANRIGYDGKHDRYGAGFSPQGSGGGRGQSSIVGSLTPS
jgi:hypothetical protein